MAGQLEPCQVQEGRPQAVRTVSLLQVTSPRGANDILGTRAITWDRLRHRKKDTKANNEGLFGRKGRSWGPRPAAVSRGLEGHCDR